MPSTSRFNDVMDTAQKRAQKRCAAVCVGLVGWLAGWLVGWLVRSFVVLSFVAVAVRQDHFASPSPILTDGWTDGTIDIAIVINRWMCCCIVEKCGDIRWEHSKPHRQSATLSANVKLIQPTTRLVHAAASISEADIYRFPPTTLTRNCLTQSLCSSAIESKMAVSARIGLLRVFVAGVC